MSAHPGPDRAGGEAAAANELVVDLVARCLEGADEEGEDAVERVCREHPEAEAAVRERLALLRRLGLAEARSGKSRSFGRYELERELGRGGMGVVYLAHDPELRRAVALKALSPRLVASERARSRFEREIRAVAQLSHPHIVPVYEVGEVDDVPYFTMEYVDGRTLDTVLRSLRHLDVPSTELNTTHLEEASFSDADGLERDDAEPSAPDDPPALAEPRDGMTPRWGKTYIETICRIVLDVADALEHAREHGVVHRDVKPSNVLISRDGRARLFDFGLARLESDEALTVTGDFAGTPFYVSPEQARGRGVDHRSDVWALGATLFELLTLRRPFEGKNAQAVFRQILTRDPPLPRKLNRLVPRDLEVVCLTALDKDPTRRYSSAGELARDLRRFLAFRPVHARPVGLGVRAARFARRNPAVAAIGLLVGFGVAAAFSALAIHDRQISKQIAIAKSEQERAEAEAARADTVSGFLADMLASVDPERSGYDVTVREILDEASARIEGSFPGQPRAEASLCKTIGNAYYELGLYAKAETHFLRALSLYERELGEDSPLAGELALDLGRALHGQQRFALAEPWIQRALRTFEANELGDAEVHALGLATQAALVADHHEDYDQAEELFQRALRMRARVFGEESLQVATSLTHLSKLRALQGDYEGALAVLDRARAIRTSQLGPDAPSLAPVMNSMGVALHRVGRMDEAERAFRQALEYAWGQMGEHHPAVGQALGNLANLKRRQGHFERAEDLARQALAIAEEFFDDDHQDVSRALTTLSYALQGQRRLDEAVACAERAESIDLALLGATHSTTASTTVHLAQLLHESGRLDEAAAKIEEILARALEGPHPDGQEVARARMRLGEIELDRGNPERAAELLELAIAHQSARHPDGSAEMILLRDSLLRARFDTGDLAAAKVVASQLARSFCGLHGEPSGSSLVQLAEIQFGLGELEAAELSLETALGFERDATGSGIVAVLTALGEVRLARGDAPGAHAPLWEAWSVGRRRWGDTSAETAGLQALYAACLLELGRGPEAEQLLLDAWSIASVADGPRCPAASRAMDVLLAHYRRAGDTHALDDLRDLRDALLLQ